LIPSQSVPSIGIPWLQDDAQHPCNLFIFLAVSHLLYKKAKQKPSQPFGATTLAKVGFNGLEPSTFTMSTAQIGYCFIYF
jgi:hypothetical protein